MNEETVLGYVPRLMALWFTKFLTSTANIGRTVVKGKLVCKQRGGLQFRNEFPLWLLKSLLE